MPFKFRLRQPPCDVSFLSIVDGEVLFNADEPTAGDIKDATLRQVGWHVVELPKEWFASREGYEATQRVLATMQCTIQYLNYRLRQAEKRLQTTDDAYHQVEEEREAVFEEVIELRERCAQLKTQRYDHRIHQPYQTPPSSGRATGGGGSLQCHLCGNWYPSRGSLASHCRKRHQQSELLAAETVAAAAVEQATAVAAKELDREQHAIRPPHAVVASNTIPTPFGATPSRGTSPPSQAAHEETAALRAEIAKMQQAVTQLVQQQSTAHTSPPPPPAVVTAMAPMSSLSQQLQAEKESAAVHREMDDIRRALAQTNAGIKDLGTMIKTSSSTPNLCLFQPAAKSDTHSPLGTLGTRSTPLLPVLDRTALADGVAGFPSMDVTSFDGGISPMTQVSASNLAVVQTPLRQVDADTTQLPMRSSANASIAARSINELPLTAAVLSPSSTSRPSTPHAAVMPGAPSWTTIAKEASPQQSVLPSATSPSPSRHSSSDARIGTSSTDLLQVSKVDLSRLLASGAGEAPLRASMVATPFPAPLSVVSRPPVFTGPATQPALTVEPTLGTSQSSSTAVPGTARPSLNMPVHDMRSVPLMESLSHENSPMHPSNQMVVQAIPVTMAGTPTSILRPPSASPPPPDATPVNRLARSSSGSYSYYSYSSSDSDVDHPHPKERSPAHSARREASPQLAEPSLPTRSPSAAVHMEDMALSHPGKPSTSHSRGDSPARVVVKSPSETAMTSMVQQKLAPLPCDPSPSRGTSLTGAGLSSVETSNSKEKKPKTSVQKKVGGAFKKLFGKSKSKDK